MMFFINFFNYYVEKCFVNFFAEYYGSPETENFFGKVYSFPFPMSYSFIWNCN